MNSVVSNPWLRAAVAALCLQCVGIAPAQAAPAAPAPFVLNIQPMAAPAQPGAIPLGTGTVGGPEQWNTFNGQRIVRNVATATLTPVLPARPSVNGPRAAVIVAPGGAFLSLSIDTEGFDIARWLADRGVAAFVLKYRLDATPPDIPGFEAALHDRFGRAPREAVPVTPPVAIADGLAAVRLVRERAAQWGIDPQRVGLMGFSAGAMTALGTAVAPDAPARPNFIAPIYPPMHAQPVPTDAPPMFLALALDDRLMANGDYGLLTAWQRAGRPVEAHFYERGDHGFGSRKQGTTSDGWFDQFMAWLASRGLLTAK
jgi:acetyl esterase/lipase